MYKHVFIYRCVCIYIYIYIYLCIYLYLHSTGMRAMISIAQTGTTANDRKQSDDYCEHMEA